ncbi:MAG: protein kinase [Hydrogenophaga sp.]|uniref:serine/threonine protein kinase n=1 Tax=Hydrogenophaga sp. TaxID=1904254 RepID=UPI002ABB947E|nr:protein kinase [Hydrogenophaga sp.]MDZ4189059.1 protein kinase [Hydrogenophaga sp.]
MSVTPLRPRHRLKSGFIVERHLGGGGFSLVYLMRDKEGRAWAVKECCCDDYVYRCPKDNASLLVRKDKNKAAKKIHEHLCNSVRKEARQFSSEKFRHPHLLPIFGSFEENNTVYLKTFYIDGVTLEDIDTEVQASTLEWRLELFEKIAAAVKHLHRVDLIHRDIKTQNIMLIKGYEDNPNPIVIDTGHAREYKDSSKDLTLIDTPFCAPETNNKGTKFGKPGPASDCFALAGVFYWLMTSQRPPTWTARDLEITSNRQDPLKQPFSINDAAWAVLRPTLSLNVTERESDPIELAENLRIAYGYPPRIKNVIVEDADGSGQKIDEKIDSPLSPQSSDWIVAILLNVAFFAFAWVILELVIPEFWVLWLGSVGVVHVITIAVASHRTGFLPSAIMPVKNIID